MAQEHGYRASPNNQNSAVSQLSKEFPGDIKVLPAAGHC
jgi:hypothetical protein